MGSPKGFVEANHLFFRIQFVPPFFPFKMGVLIPVASVTNYYKLSGLKQHRFITLQLWRSEIGLMGLQSMCF